MLMMVCDMVMVARLHIQYRVYIVWYLLCILDMYIVLRVSFQ